MQTLWAGSHARLEEAQSQNEHGERRPSHHQLDPVDREVALPSRLPVRWHSLWVPGHDRVMVGVFHTLETMSMPTITMPRPIAVSMNEVEPRSSQSSTSATTVLERLLRGPDGSPDVDAESLVVQEPSR
jgi:hypothetical protein